MSAHLALASPDRQPVRDDERRLVAGLAPAYGGTLSDDPAPLVAFESVSEAVRCAVAVAAALAAEGTARLGLGLAEAPSSARALAGLAPPGAVNLSAQVRGQARVSARAHFARLTNADGTPIDAYRLVLTPLPPPSTRPAPARSGQRGQRGQRDQRDQRGLVLAALVVALGAAGVAIWHSLDQEREPQAEAIGTPAE